MSEPLIDMEWAPGALESLLMLASEPLPTADMAQAIGLPQSEVEAILVSLQEFYDETQRGFELRRIGNGWRYYTRERYADVIAAWALEGQQGRLSQAALETLAVVAYLQPISRGRVSAVRGVNVDGVMRTLATRDLIEEVGTDAETGARLFATTAAFLEKMGLTSLEELPPIAPYLPDASALEAELSELIPAAQQSETVSDVENQSATSSESEPDTGESGSYIGESESEPDELESDSDEPASDEPASNEADPLASLESEGN